MLTAAARARETVSDIERHMEELHERLEEQRERDAEGRRDAGTVRYAEINRPISRREVRQAREAALDAGLWRFDER